MIALVAFVVGIVIGWNAHARTIGRRMLRLAREARRDYR